jgi:hypothetical protein
MTEQIEKAAMWLSEQKEPPQQVIHLLREKFGITPVQAAQACTLANQYRTNRRVFG